MSKFNPVESLARMRHEFGEHGGVNMSIEASTTFTVLEAALLPKLFQGKVGPEAGGYYLYGRHYNPTVYVLGRQMAALEGTENGLDRLGVARKFYERVARLGPDKLLVVFQHPHEHLRHSRIPYVAERYHR